jgi:Haem-binding domain/Cytochrome P460
MTGRMRWTTLAVIVGIGLGCQFVRPGLVNPPVVAELNVPADVKQIFTTSCYNCHSNETRLSWFDEIVPAYWLVAKDVKNARRHLNFSEVQHVQGSAQQDLLFEIANQIQAGIMPPRSYVLLHPEAKITPEKLQLLKNFLDPYRARTASSVTQFSTATDEYERWIAGRPAEDVRPAPNGIAFIPEYKDWRVVGSSERFDNQTVRLVLGNEAAIKAIETNDINPWPDGAILAKVAWDRLVDESGSGQPGQFKQVEFMIKDSRRFASSLGWGFARWRGVNLQPFGNDAGFVQGCVDCHTPMRERDFVFTDPVNHAASVADGLPYNPFAWRVIAADVHTQDATMSTLFGNDAAVMHARTNPNQPYPPGAVLSLITWSQQEDARWFGAKVPGSLKSIEFVIVRDSTPSYSYEMYTGSSFTPVEPPDRDARLNNILHHRALVMP